MVCVTDRRIKELASQIAMNHDSSDGTLLRSVCHFSYLRDNVFVPFKVTDDNKKI